MGGVRGERSALKFSKMVEALSGTRMHFLGVRVLFPSPSLFFTGSPVSPPTLPPRVLQSGRLSGPWFMEEPLADSRYVLKSQSGRHPTPPQKAAVRFVLSEILWLHVQLWCIIEVRPLIIDAAVLRCPAMPKCSSSLVHRGYANSTRKC